MGGVTREWEAAAEPAAAAGARLVTMRTSVVLDRRGGALKLMLPAFRLGLGGPIGSGSQYFATISLTDWLRAATHLATSEGSVGTYNLSAPHTTTNAEFARCLGRLLHRPAVVPVPAVVVTTLAGTVASEALNSTRVEPARLLFEGFRFDHPTLQDRLTAALG
jgi:uncharacterized protein (TIGR01777 family)